MRTFLIWLTLAAASFGADGVTVTETQILGHGDPVPRFARLPGNHLIVPAGETVTLAADSTWDAIEVSGTLKASREADTVCRFVHLTILPSGKLDCGTEADPVLRKVQFIQKLERTWATMGEVKAGATTLTLKVPAGWQVGDELLIPDTRQVLWGSLRAVPKIEGLLVPIRRETKVTITAIDGDTVTLSKPLDFEHHAARWLDGSIASPIQDPGLPYPQPHEHVDGLLDIPSGQWPKGKILEYMQAQYLVAYLREQLAVATGLPPLDRVTITREMMGRYRNTPASFTRVQEGIEARWES